MRVVLFFFLLHKNFTHAGYASFMFNCCHNVIQQRLKWNPNREAKSCPFQCALGTLLGNNGEKVAVFKVPWWSIGKALTSPLYALIVHPNVPMDGLSAALM